MLDVLSISKRIDVPLSVIVNEVEHSLKDPSVYEIARHQTGENIDFTPKEMAEKVAIYALAITMESVNRESNIRLEAPNLDNVLSMDRIIAYKDVNPDFVKILKQACIIRNSEKGWFKNIKEKLL